MPDPVIQVDGADTFVLGMDSYTQPSKLENGEFAVGMNLICRGGIAQTRPGSVSLFTASEDDECNIQGLTFFRPSSGTPHLVFAIDGLVYVSAAPFTIFTQLSNIQFSPNSQFVAWASTVKTTYYDATGVQQFLDNPYSVLIMQDGATRAAYWDGSSSGHINPAPSGQTTTLPDRDGTPVGLWMAWSNNRLWVSRKNQVFASDIGDPLKFTESQYLNEGRAFYLPGNCTGIIETADQQGIMCFTAETGTFLNSSIQDRTLWLTTPQFQKTVLPNVGCIAPRSLVEQYGLLWWFTPKGLINQDDALRLNITSRLNIQDNEMFQSKSNLSFELSGVCGAFVENFLFHAVPNGDSQNNRIHVLDQAPFENFANSWASYWTGWRPVEFARGVVSSQERAFCISRDYDGITRVWELFRPEKTDNGMPITSFIATRQHFFGNRDWKRFRYAELEFVNISGPTAVMVAAGGTKGAYQTVMTKDINSINGQVYADSIYGENDASFYGSRPQSRVVRTEDGANPSDCNAECVEYDQRGLIDKAFSLLVVWSGIAGLSAYRMFTISNPQALDGICEDNETGEDRLVTPAGCGALSIFSVADPFETYYASATFERIDPVSGDPVSNTSTQASIISQVDADRKAAAMAEWYVLSEIGEII